MDPEGSYRIHNSLSLVPVNTNITFLDIIHHLVFV
jgi:hypothetical protein